MPDEVEKVAVLPGRGVGPLPRYAGSVEADEERAAASAVQIAGDPVAALLAAVRQVAPADGFGVGAERGGDAGGGRRFVLHAGLLPIRAGRPIPAGLRLGLAPEGRRAAHRAGAAPERASLGIGCKKKGRHRSAGQVGREETKR